MAIANIKATFLCPVEKIWDVVTDLSDYRWRSDISKIVVIDDKNFVEYTKDGFKTEFNITKKELYRLWEFNLENENISGCWSGKFYKQGDKTTLDFTENVTAKKLLLKPLVGAYLRKQQKQYFADLKKKLLCKDICSLDYIYH